MNVKVYIALRSVAAALLPLVLANISAAQTGDSARSSAVNTIFQEATAAQRAGHLEEAATGYQRVLELQPRFAEAGLNLGLVREEQGKYADAVTVLSKAVAIKPGLRGAYMFLAIAE